MTDELIDDAIIDDAIIDDELIDDAAPAGMSMPSDVGTAYNRPKASKVKQFLASLMERQRQQSDRMQANPLRALASGVANAAMPFSPGGLYRTATGAETSPSYLPDPTLGGMAKGATNVGLGAMRLAGQVENARPDWLPSPVNAATRAITGNPSATFNDAVTKPLIRSRNEAFDQNVNPSLTGEMAGEFLATGGAAPAVSAASKSGLLMNLLKGFGRGAGAGAAGSVVSNPGTGTETDDEYTQGAMGRGTVGALAGGTLGAGGQLLSPIVAKIANARKGLPTAAADFESLAKANQIPTDVSNLPGAPHMAQSLAETLQQAKIGGISEEVAKRSAAATEQGGKLSKMLSNDAAETAMAKLDSPTPARVGMYGRVKDAIGKLNSKSTRGEVAKAQANATLYNAKVWADRESEAIAKEADALGPINMTGPVKRMEAVKQAYVNELGDKANPSVLASIDKTIESVAGKKGKPTETGLFDSLGKAITKSGVDEPAANFSRAKAVRSANNAEMTRLTSGKDALVSKKEAVPLTQVNDILEDAMRGHVAAKKPDLDARYGKFLVGYRENVVPFKDRNVAAALSEDSLPQDVYRKLMMSLPEGEGGNKALRALGGEKLQRTLSAEWFDDVLKAATTPGEQGGRVIPDVSDARGLQNQVDPKKALDRVQATLRSYRNTIPEGDSARELLDNYFKVISRMPEIAKGSSSKLQWTDIWLRAPLSIVKKLVTTDKGKAFLLASSKFKDQAAYDKFVGKNLPFIVGGATGEDKLKTLLGAE